MSFWALWVLALGLAADAAAVSVANGIGHPRRPFRLALSCGLCFGTFQAAMTLAGYWAGFSFLHLISAFDHWIALALLGAIGGRMIAAALQGMRSPSGPAVVPRLTLGALLLQAFATSVDAMAVGVGLGVIDVDIPLALALIASVTFVCCFAGVLLGRLAGNRFCGAAQLAGGCLLVFIGLHIVAEHLLPRM